MSLGSVFAGMVDSGRVPHAILLHEDDGGGGIPLAVSFLKYLYCQNRSEGEPCGTCPSCSRISKLIHPDIHFIFPTAGADVLSESLAASWRDLVLSNPGFCEADLAEALGTDKKSANIAVAESKALLSKLSLSALEGGYRSAVVYLPEKMNAEAANRLLKIIEEPPQKTQFILVTHNPDKVLRTIYSRCQLFRVQPQGTTRTITAEAAAIYTELFSALMDALCSKDLVAAVEAGEAIAALPSRESTKSFCIFASEQMRTLFLLQQNIPGMSAALEGNFSRWAGALRKTFPRKSLEALDRAAMLIGRNVNAKILFTDLVGSLYTFV